MAEPRLIRKYANRRLYDTQTSKHINLDRVRELIVGGEEIRVVDDTSGDDITRHVLLQLVSDQELGGRPVLSDQMLTQIIRFYDHPMQGMLGSYLQQSFEMFLQQQQNLTDHMQDMIRTGPFAAFQDMASQNMDTWMSMRKEMLDPKKNEDDE